MLEYSPMAWLTDSGLGVSWGMVADLFCLYLNIDIQDNIPRDGEHGHLDPADDEPGTEAG